MFFLYNFILIILFPVWILYLWKSQKRLAFKERIGFVPRRDDNPVWIHAVSLGEAKIALNLIKKFKDDNLPFAVSTTTSSGKEEFKKNGIEAFFFPIDFILFMKIALKRLKPKALIVVETEIWPSLFNSCCKMNIDIFIVNARISEKQFTKYIRFKKFFLDFINKIWILASSKEFQRRYVKIGANEERTIVTGNMKFDIEAFDERKMKEFKLSMKDFLPQESKIWIAGSIRENEEEAVLLCQKEIAQHIENVKVIIAPRHLNRVGKIIELCYKMGLKVVLKSEFPSKDWDVFILDSYGELMYAYSLSTIAFVGGSLVNLGGQNPLEPARWGSAVLIGNSYENFKEEVDALKENGGVIIVKNQEELKEKITYLFKNEDDMKKIGEKGLEVLQKGKGATERTYTFIKQKLCYQNQSFASLSKEVIEDD